MPPKDRSHIVADGRERILEGSGREAADRMHVRLPAVRVPLLERAGPVGRLVIRYRISRFVRRRLERLAPPEAVYSSQPFGAVASGADSVASVA